jgi:uroporphyrinogen decarboxylase
MNARERVLTALRREGVPDRIPFEISWGAFTPLLMKTFREKTGSDLSPEEYFDFDTRFVLPGPTRRTNDFSKYFTALEDNVSFSEWGVGAVPTRFEIPDYKYHPLEQMETVEQINGFAWPDLGEEYRYVDVAAKIETYHQRGYAVCGEMYQTLFEMAWLMRGMQTLMTDFVLNPELAHAICEKITEIRVQQARQFAKAGVDIIRLGDDIVTQQGRMFSSEMYREFLLPRVRRIVVAAKQVNPEVMIFMHSCGKVEEVIDDLIEAGIDVLNPLQPECNNLAWIKETYGNRLSFWGGLGVQSVMPHGTPDDVRNAVRQTADQLGKGGGFLLAPAHILDPSVPWDNIEAFIEAVKK